MRAHASRRALRWRAALAPMIVLVLATAVYWPALHSFLVRDDFAQMAYARLLGSPWVLFVHDHFAPAGTFYRPLGFALLWLSEALFGTTLWPHYLLNLSLHAGVALALYGVLRIGASSRAPAGAGALLFALHPVTIGTAVWLSDRFDLLATLMLLLAVRCAWRYRLSLRPRDAGFTIALALLAILSKETGLLTLAPVTLLWWWPDGGDGRGARHSRIAWLVLLAVVVAYFVWRMHVLHGVGGQSLVSLASVSQVLLAGMRDWWVHAPGYLAYLPRLGTLAAWVVTAGLILIGVVVLLALRGIDRRRWRGEFTLLVLCALSLILAPALIQAPVVLANGAPLNAGMTASEAAMQSRLYYLALAGVIWLLSLVAQAAAKRASARAARLGLAGMLVLTVPLGLAAHRLAAAWSDESQVLRPLARTAVAAVKKLDLPAGRCQVYFLDAPVPRGESVVTSIDAIVKARAPDIEPLAHCLLQREHAPYFYTVARDAVTPRDAAPMLPLKSNGEDVQWPVLGNLQLVYLNLYPGVDGRDIRGAIFLAWADGGFHDVTDRVRRGIRAVHFHCVRSPSQCPSADSLDR